VIRGAIRRAPIGDYGLGSGWRRTIWPFIGITDRISESPLPSRCGHAAPTLVQKLSSPLLVTCQAWKAGVLGSVVVVVVEVRAMMKFLSYPFGSLPPSDRPLAIGRVSCPTRVSAANRRGPDIDRRPRAVKKRVDANEVNLKRGEVEYGIALNIQLKWLGIQSFSSVLLEGNGF
jgi:hypothetical protein